MAMVAKGIPFEAGGVVAAVTDEQLVATLLANYRTYLSGQMMALRQAADEQWTAEVHRIAHAIRGGALTIRAAQLAEIAEKLEKATRTDDWATIDSLVPRLDDEVEDLMSGGVVSMIGRSS